MTRWIYMCLSKSGEINKFIKSLKRAVCFLLSNYFHAVREIPYDKGACICELYIAF